MYGAPINGLIIGLIGVVTPIYISGVIIPLIIGRGWILREDDLFGTDYIDDL